MTRTEWLDMATFSDRMAHKARERNDLGAALRHELDADRYRDLANNAPDTDPWTEGIIEVKGWEE